MASINGALLLTPGGAAAIAIVRLRGQRVPSFARECLGNPLKLNRCVHTTLHDDGRILDDPVAVLVDEQTLDLNLHGSPWIVRATLELAARHGFEILEPNLPLAPEALDADSLLEQEMLSHLPLALTDLGLRVLLAQPAAWNEFIHQAAMDDKTLRGGIESILTHRGLHFLLNPPTVAIIGAPNAGKSTLANQLFGQERSITADLPGTTRDYIGEMADIDGLAVHLLDTPGLRETNDPIEAQAIAHSADHIARADLLILVVDASRPHDVGQSALLQRFPQALPIANKSDLTAKPFIGLPTIATTGAGIPALRQAITARFDCADISIDRPRCWTDRQRQILTTTLNHPSALAALIGRLP